MDLAVYALIAIGFYILGVMAGKNPSNWEDE